MQRMIKKCLCILYVVLLLRSSIYICEEKETNEKSYYNDTLLMSDQNDHKNGASQNAIQRIDENTDITIIYTSRSSLTAYLVKQDIMDKIGVSNFYEMAISYGVDPGFACATWIWETGWGKSSLWNEAYNPAGIVCQDRYCSYSDTNTGMIAMFALLRCYTQGESSYIGVRKTPLAIRAMWSETDDVAEIVALWNAIYNEKES